MGGKEGICVKSKELVKRYALFVTSLFFSALGVAFTKTGGLGVSPVSSVANVLSLRFPGVSMGQWLILWSAVLILGQILVLRRRYQPIQLLQLPMAVLFGWFTDGGMVIAGLSFLPFMGLFPFTGMVDLSVGLAFLFVVIVGTICSFVLYLGSTKYISPADASIIAALEPLSSILLAFAVFGQDFGSFELLGMALIIAAVGVVSVHQ